MTEDKIKRRALLGGMVAAPAALAASNTPAATEGDDAFKFTVTRTEEEWRERLTDDEYVILRGGATEPPKSSPYWEMTTEDEGIYHCKGCDLPLFDAYWKVVLDIGWVFYRQAEPLTVITEIDRPNYREILSGEASPMMAPELSEEEIRALDTFAGVKATCRRCGSHLGHIISNKGRVLYCINGASLEFNPATA